MGLTSTVSYSLPLSEAEAAEWGHLQETEMGVSLPLLVEVEEVWALHQAESEEEVEVEAQHQKEPSQK